MIEFRVFLDPHDKIVLDCLDLKGGATQITYSHPCSLKCSASSTVTLIIYSVHQTVSSFYHVQPVSSVRDFSQTNTLTCTFKCQVQWEGHSNCLLQAVTKSVEQNNIYKERSGVLSFFVNLRDGQ